MPKHTPGPWRVEELYDDFVITVGPPTGSLIAEVDPLHEIPSHAKANAHLMAASPDLLEALEFIAAWVPSPGLAIQDAIDTARAAISKAIPE